MRKTFLLPFLLLSAPAFAQAPASPCDEFARKAIDTQVLTRNTESDVLVRARRQLEAIAMRKLPFTIQEGPRVELPVGARRQQVGGQGTEIATIPVAFTDQEFKALGMSLGISPEKEKQIRSQASQMVYQVTFKREQPYLNRPEGTPHRLDSELLLKYIQVLSPESPSGRSGPTLQFGRIDASPRAPANDRNLGSCFPQKVTRVRQASDRFWSDRLWKEESTAFDFYSCLPGQGVFANRKFRDGAQLRSIEECANAANLANNAQLRASCGAAIQEIGPENWEKLGEDRSSSQFPDAGFRVSQRTWHWLQACSVVPQDPARDYVPATDEDLKRLISEKANEWLQHDRAARGVAGPGALPAVKSSVDAR